MLHFLVVKVMLIETLQSAGFNIGVHPMLSLLPPNKFLIKKLS